MSRHLRFAGMLQIRHHRGELPHGGSLVLPNRWPGGAGSDPNARPGETRTSVNPGSTILRFLHGLEVPSWSMVQNSFFQTGDDCIKLYWSHAALL